MKQQPFKFPEHTVVAEVMEFTAEYADCGSHRLKITLTLDDEGLSKLRDQIQHATGQESNA